MKYINDLILCTLGDDNILLTLRYANQVLDEGSELITDVTTGRWGLSILFLYVLFQKNTKNGLSPMKIVHRWRQRKRGYQIDSHVLLLKAVPGLDQQLWW